MSLSTLLKIHNINSNHKFDVVIFGQMTLEKPTREKPVEKEFLLFLQAIDYSFYRRN